MNPIWQFSLDYGPALIWLGSLLLALWWGSRFPSARQLVTTTLVLTFVLIVLGAYVRLSDAGLGCPDWPGCYGQLTPKQAAADIQKAYAEAPQGPVSMPKAWKEMVHRYLASLVGALIVAILWQGIRHSRQRQYFASAQPRLGWRLPAVLLAVVILQGLFGKWTVTLLLKPAIVTGHLLGGMSVLGLLAWQLQRLQPHSEAQAANRLAGYRLWAVIALATLGVQIALGGWVSTNYAAAVCGELPTCQGQWWPETDMQQGFHVVRELGKTADGQHLSLAALTAIHWTHRLFALIVLIIVGGLAWRLYRQRIEQPLALGLLAVLAGQITLGLSVVYSMASEHLHLTWQLPLAAAHNGGAALLLILLIRLNCRCHTQRQHA
ncbi:COX15/CtaA family protein [Parvibium lacunae]|uniref:Heme A synthase n=1 Tax=Parvibium lacunae TaxID=1888893 RepID=A0A368KZW4_9BURK|nr:COX15/CtaA family protein [Parvibium lacunae]RCS56846.1 heme A synthase [Parvibium lacunae]